ncbi:hypothetical protein OH77DRAFT_1422893 [Trametes cingulata]|nr:hypothetical protein OH77DRAFT_1422893 [Trametes cingulata]
MVRTYLYEHGPPAGSVSYALGGPRTPVHQVRQPVPGPCRSVDAPRCVTDPSRMPSTCGSSESGVSLYGEHLHMSTPADGTYRICTVQSTRASSLPVPAHPSHGPHSCTPLDVPVLPIHDTSGIRTLMCQIYPKAERLRPRAFVGRGL